MEIFIDKNNQPNVIKREEFISRIYSSLLKVDSTLKAEEVFHQALKLLNKLCFWKTPYSILLVDICIIKILQYHNLNTAAACYVNPNINDESIDILNLERDDISKIIKD